MIEVKRTESGIGLYKGTYLIKNIDKLRLNPQKTKILEIIINDYLEKEDENREMLKIKPNYLNEVNVGIEDKIQNQFYIPRETLPNLEKIAQKIIFKGNLSSKLK